MERPYVFMQRALVTFKAAGLHSPLAGPAQEEFWLQLWVERYGALEASLFTGCVKKLAGERYFPRLHDMDEAVQDAQKRLLHARCSSLFLFADVRGSSYFWGASKAIAVAPAAASTLFREMGATS